MISIVYCTLKLVKWQSPKSEPSAEIIVKRTESTRTH